MAPEPSLRPKSRACARLASARACGRRTANEVAFSVARETARMTFARSHAARVPENGIWNRAANLAPAVAGEIISAQRPFHYAKQKPQRPYSPPPALLLLGAQKQEGRGRAVRPLRFLLCIVERPLRRNNFPGNGRREVGRSIPNPVFRHTRSV